MGTEANNISFADRYSTGFQRMADSTGLGQLTLLVGVCSVANSIFTTLDMLQTPQIPKTRAMLFGTLGTGVALGGTIAFYLGGCALGAFFCMPDVKKSNEIANA